MLFSKTFSYHIKQPVLFSAIILIKTEAYFVNLTNIFCETNLLQNNYATQLCLQMLGIHVTLPILPAVFYALLNLSLISYNYLY